MQEKNDNQNKEVKLENNLKAFRTSKMAEWVREYKASFNPVDEVPVEVVASFNHFTNNRIKNVSGFDKITAPDGISIATKLPPPPAPVAGIEPPDLSARGRIATALSETDATKRAQTVFNSKFTNLNTFLRTEPGRYTSKTVADLLLKIKGEAEGKIKEQHSIETTNLTNLFADEAFRTLLKNDLNCDDVQVDAVKKQMLETLAASQKEALATFEKTMNDHAKDLFDDFRKQAELKAFLADRKARDEQMRAEMNNLGPSDENDPVYLEINGDTGDATLRGITVENLTRITTINKHWYHETKVLQKGPDGTYSIRLNRLFQTDQTIYEDLTSLAQTIRASGKETITFDVNNPNDPKKAEEIARKAYESAIIAGFDPKKITIRVNGELKFKYSENGEKEKDELFKDKPQRLKQAEDKAEQIAATRKEWLDKVSPEVGVLNNTLQGMVPAEPDEPVNEHNEIDEDDEDPDNAPAL